MVEILDICEYLHGRFPSVVHRDIKPANLIRQPDGQLVLVDFGSVRDTLRDAVPGGGSIAGTVGYMAPEQLAGQAEPASDLYAIAMTAITLLAREEPAALHDRAGRPCWEHMVSVSEGTTKLLRAMLEADPANRPQSAAVVRGYIEQLLVADEDARNNADIGPTLVPTPSPLFDGPTGVHGSVFDEPTSSHDQELLELTGTHQPPLPVENHRSDSSRNDGSIALLEARRIPLQAILAVTALAAMLGVGLGLIL
jgi:serine/threonine protein kinase